MGRRVGEYFRGVMKTSIGASRNSVKIWVVVMMMLSGRVTEVNGNSAACVDDTIILNPGATAIYIPDADLEQYYSDTLSQSYVSLVSSVDNNTFVPGTNILMAQNANTNMTECTVTLTIVVPTAPVCPDDLTVGTDPDAVTAVVSWTDPGNNHTDILPLASSPEINSTFPIGDTTVTILRTNFTELNCSFIVTVVDDEPPTFTTSVGQSVTFVGADSVTWEIEASDNADIVTLTSTHNPGDYFPVGNTTVTYWATDRYGLVTNVTFVVTIIDDGSPYIDTCPDDQVLEVPAGTTSKTVTWSDPTVDEAEPVQWTSDYSSGDAFPLGTTLVTYTATFENDPGNSSKCFFKIMVTATTDEGKPDISDDPGCPASFTVDVPPGSDQYPVSWDEPVFEDDVDGTSLYVQKTKQPGDTFRPGSTTVLYTAMDSTYNAATPCLFTVTVNVLEDNEAPVFDNCPANITHWVTTGTASAAVTWSPPINVTDNFPGVTLESSHESGDDFTTGEETAVSYVAVDKVGNTAFCNFTVLVQVDDEPPSIVCPGSITEYVPEDQTQATITWSSSIVTDNSEVSSVTAIPASGTVFQASAVGQNDEVVVTATDIVGNEESCSFYVNVIVDNAPTLTCPDVVEGTLPGQSYGDAYWSDVIISDDFTSVSALVNTSSSDAPIRLSYTDDPVTVTLTATDERGNTGECTFTVEVRDMEGPVWTPCPDNVTVAAEPGTNSATVSWTAPTASDNSGQDPVIVNVPAATSQLFSGGAWPISYTAIDDSDNIGVCEFDVIVTVDADVPVYQNCPTETVYVNAESEGNSAVVTWAPITAADDGGDVTVTSNFVSGVTLEIGSYDVEYEAVDTSGNIAYCRFRIVVLDVENPYFSFCPPSQDVYVHETTSSVVVTWSQPIANDNSGSVTVSLASGSMASGSRFTQGSHTIVYDATDANSNTVSTCQFTIDIDLKPETIEIRGQLLLDTVRGLDGIFTDQTRLANLGQDLDDYFRHSTTIGQELNFVGIQITSSRFDTDENYLIQFSLHLCDPSFYNRAEIQNAFVNALTSSKSFPTANNIVPDSFDLHVKEYRGLFTLRSIVTPGTTAVDFLGCCSNPASASYSDLVNRIQPHLDRAFDGVLDNFLTTRLLRLRAGSVVVPFTVTVDDSSSSTTDGVEISFDAAVEAVSRELIANGVATGLYLEERQPPYLTLEEICPDNYCANNGVCTVTNATFVYDYECSCPSGYSGDRCETTGTSTPSLTTGAIIGIALGGVALFLLVLLLCCCILMCANRSDGRKRDMEYGNNSPMMLMPMDIPQRPAIMDRTGPIITEVRDSHEGPYYDYDYDVQPPVVDPYSIPPHIPRPVTLGPSFLHEVEGRAPPQREPRRGRIRSLMPTRLPRPRLRESSGPRFHGNGMPEPVEDMKRRLYREFNY